MPRISFSRSIVCLAALGLLLACLPRAAEARETFAFFSVQPPDGVTVREEGRLVTAGRESDGKILTIRTVPYEFPDVDGLINKSAGDNRVRTLKGELGYVFENHKGMRTWGMITENGLQCEFSVNGPWDGLADFVSTMEPAHNADGMNAIIGAAKSKAVQDWLNFVVPAFAEPAPPRQTVQKSQLPSKNYEGKGLTATMPEDWRVMESQVHALFASKDSAQSVSAQAITLDTDDFDTFLAAAKEIRAAFNGANFLISEGAVSFDIGDDAHATLEQHGPIALFLTIQGEGPDLEDVAASVRLQ